MCRQVPTCFLTSESRNELIHFSFDIDHQKTVVGLLACSVKMSGSKPKLKVRTSLDEIFINNMKIA
jgi:hypothetical protein